MKLVIASYRLGEMSGGFGETGSWISLLLPDPTNHMLTMRLR